ncbi:hypothetical protein ACF061_17065 [Streptomyces sp. NPDC015220]|uniref:hypothetical protein n=1 Tax=Streptomyces sp. NPDC015220 TaxID=3364947 RepID=UPI0036F8D5C2
MGPLAVSPEAGAAAAGGWGASVEPEPWDVRPLSVATDLCTGGSERTDADGVAGVGRAEPVPIPARGAVSVGVVVRGAPRVPALARSEAAAEPWPPATGASPPGGTAAGRPGAVLGLPPEARVVPRLPSAAGAGVPSAVPLPAGAASVPEVRPAGGTVVRRDTGSVRCRVVEASRRACVRDPGRDDEPAGTGLSRGPEAGSGS